MIENQLKSVIRDIPNFPKEGIVFKDITPIFKDYKLVQECVNELVEFWRGKEIDVVVGVESRGFLLGPMMANKLKVPFVPIRKKGKLPYKTIEESYDLEYGQATIEVHEDAFKSGAKVLVHDDLLATGGTAIAASSLIKKMEAEVAGFSFLIELKFLEGEKELQGYSNLIHSLVKY